MRLGNEPHARGGDSRSRSSVSRLLIALISLLGGLAGILLSLPVNGISTGTTNFSTFSEVAFNFRVDAPLALQALMLALIAGVFGGVLPAIAAARMPITKALREI